MVAGKVKLLEGRHRVFFSEMSSLFGSAWIRAYGDEVKESAPYFQMCVDKLELPDLPPTDQAGFLRSALQDYAISAKGWPDVATAIDFVNNYSGDLNADAAFNEAQKLSHPCNTNPRWSHITIREAARMTTHTTLSGDQRSASRQFAANYRTALTRYKRGELVDANYDIPALPTQGRTSTSKEDAKAHLRVIRSKLNGE